MPPLPQSRGETRHCLARYIFAAQKRRRLGRAQDTDKMADEMAVDRPVGAGLGANKAGGQAQSGARKPREPGCIAFGEASFFQQLTMMRRAFMGSPLRRLLLLVTLGIFALIVATAFGQVLLNRWNRPFYDAIERKNVPDFLNQLVIFAYIAGGLLVLNIAQGWLNRYLHIKLREGLVRDLLDQWLRPGRALRLKRSGELGVNPDQRLHEDAWHLADLSADLGIGFTQSRPTSASVSRRRACSWRASSACCGRSRRASSSTMTAAASPSPATWCGRHSPMPASRRASPGCSAGR